MLGAAEQAEVALARAMFCAVFPLGLLWTAVSRENRSVADLLLRTSVVYDWLATPATVGEVPHGRFIPGG